MTYSAFVLLTIMFLSITPPSCSHPMKQENEVKESDEEFFENALRDLCPIKKEDGSICESKGYKTLKDEGKLASERHWLKNRKELVAFNHCCKEKECILACRSSPVLEGYPDNWPLLMWLDSQLLKNLTEKAGKIRKDQDTLDSIDRMIFESTDHYQKLMLRETPLLTFEQMYRGFRDYRKLMGREFTSFFPGNYKTLRNLDSNLFSGLSESLQEKFSCRYFRGINEFELDYWKLIVVLNEQHFRDVMEKETNFRKYGEFKYRC